MLNKLCCWDSVFKLWTGVNKPICPLVHEKSKSKPLSGSNIWIYSFIFYLAIFDYFSRCQTVNLNHDILYTSLCSLVQKNWIGVWGHCLSCVMVNRIFMWWGIDLTFVDSCLWISELHRLCGIQCDVRTIFSVQ